MMEQYHKIKTVWERDPETNYKTLIHGKWALPEFGFLQNNHWLFTEKVDGTNVRIIVEDGGIRFAGKSDAAVLPRPLLDSLRDTHLAFRDRFCDLFAGAPAYLYGEGYGAGIQKGGGLYRPDQGFVLFDVRVGEWWLRRSDVEDIAGELSLNVVPVIGAGTLNDMITHVIDGFDSQWGRFRAEGIVARPAVELFDRGGRRIITKVKCKDFDQG